MRTTTQFLLLPVILMNLHAPSPGREIPHRTAAWEPESLGNHRVRLEVPHASSAVAVRVPWRRRDRNPSAKGVLLFSAEGGRRVSDLLVLKADSLEGVFVFRPAAGPGVYFLYYLPFRSTGSKHYPKVQYLPPEKTASPEWIQENRLTGVTSRSPRLREIPKARVVAFESRGAFHSFYPMEVSASPTEVKALLDAHPDAPFLLFPENRKYPIRMDRGLPLRWIHRGPGGPFQGTARQGEYYAFQVGVFACRKDLSSLQVRCPGFVSLSGRRLSMDPVQCFQTSGIDWLGRAFKKNVTVPLRRVQALWLGVQVPRDAPPGIYEGRVVVTAKGLPPRSVPVRIQVQGPPVTDAGDGDPRLHSRLRWLHSRIGAGGDPVKPFLPLVLEEDLRRITLLGRRVVLGAGGLPARIQSFFDPSVTSIRPTGGTSVPILATPVRLLARDGPGGVVSWKIRAFRFTKKTKTLVGWESSWEAPERGLTLSLQGRIEFDGFLGFELGLAAARPTALSGVEFLLTLPGETARYMMGLGFKGGKRPKAYSWKWDPKKNQDALWVGRADAGIQAGWRDDRYVRPLNTNFYHLKPLVMPRSWCNEGKGGVEASEDRRGDFIIRAYSGPLDLREGETLRFDFNLLVTPFKPLDTRKHFQRRYYHAFEPIERIAAAGANVVNVHHATPVNPFINYPFLRIEEMKAYIDQAHRLGMKVKIYDTVRELSNHAPEIFALESFGDEIFAPGPGGGPAWLQEHMDGNYIAGWYVRRYEDAAIITNGVSRWHNYYLEGLDYLARKAGIDGLYLDDVAFDRTVMQRARRILERRRGHCIIDLHSANQYNPRDGFASSANLYMEHFPYLDRLWFGEYFDYDSPPDYWLVELSGIPFGLMGEMLQGGGNPWRGMLFGMTARLPWAGDPRALWKVWDRFGIEESRMIGWWDPACPVKTGDQRVLATVYLKDGKALVALASWAPDPVTVTLAIDWKAFRLDPRKTLLEAPAIQDFQEARVFRPGDPIPIPPGRGLLIRAGSKN